MEAAWKGVIGQLTAATGDEFERTALHYLRVIWPDMIQATRLQQIDRRGIDLLVSGTNTHMEVIVQAKGFKVDEDITRDQVDKQILPSIEKFRKSEVTTDLYLLLHNRNGRNRELAGEIDKALARLKQDGKAKEARLLDVYRFVKEVRHHIDGLIRAKLRQRSEQLLLERGRFFHFGHLFVPEVPVSQKSWKPGSVIQGDLDARTFDNLNASKLITTPRKVRYSILTGSFGIGKTTTALHAATLQDKTVVFVPAHSILRTEGSQGTNYFLRNLNTELDLLDDLPADSAEIVGNTLGASLGRILRQANDEFVLVVDGLDEHSFYGTSAGLHWLTNELAELRCPIVLTTRREHFLALVGSYTSASDSLSKMGGSNRLVEIFQLGAWSTTQASLLIHKAIAIAENPQHKASMERLLNLLSSDSTPLSESLLSHPLFLQMTLDLIVEEEDWVLNEPQVLMETWIRQKIRRDLQLPRLASGLPLDADEYCVRMMTAMREIAIRITENRDIQNKSEGVIDANDMTDTVRRALGLPHLSVAEILNTSLLTPASARRGSVLSVKFFHQAFLDYFLQRTQ